jgi:hypothetical protein
MHLSHLPICCQYLSTNTPQSSPCLLPVSVYQYTTIISLSVASISLPMHHSHPHTCCQYRSTSTPQPSTYLLPVSDYQCTTAIYLSVASISLPIALQPSTYLLPVSVNQYTTVIYVSVAGVSLPMHPNHLHFCCQYHSTNEPQRFTYLLPVSVYRYTITIYLSVVSIILLMQNSLLPICCQYQSTNANRYIPICCQYHSTNAQQPSTYLLPVTVYQCTTSIYLSVGSISLSMRHTHLPICYQYPTTNTPHPSIYMLPVSVCQCTAAIYLSVGSISLPRPTAIHIFVASISLRMHNSHLPICCQYQSTNALPPSIYLLPVSVHQYTTAIYLSFASITLPIHHNHPPICCQYRSTNCPTAIYLSFTDTKLSHKPTALFINGIQYNKSIGLFLMPAATVCVNLSCLHISSQKNTLQRFGHHSAELGTLEFRWRQSEGL